MPFERLFRLCTTNRRMYVRPLVSVARGAMVKLRFQNAQGEALPSMNESMTAEDAEALGQALIAAAAVARHQHAARQPEGKTA